MRVQEVLLIGAGSNHALKLKTPAAKAENKITTLDIEPSHGVDVVHDLNIVPWPFDDGVFNEVHAYEVLEHLGQQGDAIAFFDHFYEAYRILRPGGLLVGSVPSWDSLWALGDPSHRRVINEGSLRFLDYPSYAAQVGVTAMTDFRSIWDGDFEAIHLEKTKDQLFFVLKAHKPRRQ